MANIKSYEIKISYSNHLCYHGFMDVMKDLIMEKHGPRDSVNKNRGRRPRFLSLLRPEGHDFHTAWDTSVMKSDRYLVI